MHVTPCERQNRPWDKGSLYSIYSWMGPMMKFVIDETRSVESITNFTLEEPTNRYFYHATQ